MPTADQLDQMYESDKHYAAGIPIIPDERIDQMYADLGLDTVTGTPVKRRIATGKVTAGGPVIVTASTFEVKRAAKACGCRSCLSALFSVQDAVVWYTEEIRENGKNHHRYARANRNFYLANLRDVVFS